MACAELALLFTCSPFARLSKKTARGADIFGTFFLEILFKDCFLTNGIHLL